MRSIERYVRGRAASRLPCRASRAASANVLRHDSRERPGCRAFDWFRRDARTGRQDAHPTPHTLLALDGFSSGQVSSRFDCRLSLGNQFFDDLHWNIAAQCLYGEASDGVPEYDLRSSRSLIITLLMETQTCESVGSVCDGCRPVADMAVLAVHGIRYLVASVDGAGGGIGFDGLVVSLAGFWVFILFGFLRQGDEQVAG